MRGLLRGLLLIGISIPSAFAATYFSYPIIHPAQKKEKVVMPITTFTTNLQNNFNIKGAHVEITRDENYESLIGGKLDEFEIPFTKDDKLYLDFSGDIGITNLNFGGSLEAKLNTKPLLATDFIYNGDSIFLGANLGDHEFETNLKFTASSIADIVKVIPMDGLGDLPSKLGIGEIDIAELSNILSKMTDVTEEFAETDEYPAHFRLPISFLKNTEGEEFSIIFCANEDLKPVSIFAEHPAYVDGFKIALSVDEMNTLDEDFAIDAPANNTKYKDLDPVLNGVNNIIPQIMDLVDNPQFNVGLEANIYSSTQKEMEVIGDFNIDVTNNVYDINLDVNDKLNTDYKGINVAARYEDNTTYINFNDGVLKGYIDTDSVNEAIEHIEELLGKDLLTFLMDKLDEITASEDVQNILENFDSIPKILNAFKLTWDDNNIYVSIAAEKLGLEEGVITLSINHNDGGLNYIKVIGLKVKDYSFDFKISLREFKEVTPIDKENYAELNCFTNLISIIPSLIEEKSFSLSGTAYLRNEETNEKIVDVKLASQFDINASSYYGNVIIEDPDNVRHSLDYLYEGEGNIYLRYDNADRLNDDKSIKAKINVDSIDETYMMIMDFINYLKDIDEKTESLFDSLSNILDNPAFAETIREVVMNLDNEKLNIQVEKCDPKLEDGTENIITVNVNMSMFGADDMPISLSIGLNKDNFTYLELHELNIKDVGVLGAKIYLDSFSSELLDHKISSTDTYYDFDDIKVLLKFAINTAEFSAQNYWYIEGTFHFTVLGIEISVPYQIYIKNNETKIEVSMRLTVSGGIMGLGKALFGENYASSKRCVSLYYFDGYLYIHRQDRVRNDLIGLSTTDYSTLYSMTLDDLLSYDSPIHVITKDVMDFSSTISDAIDKAIEDCKTDEPIKYEQIINNFTHNPSNKEFYISLNFAELTNNPDMTKFDVYIYYKGTNMDNYVLDSAKIYMTADVGISLDLDFDLYLKDYTQNYESAFTTGYSIRDYIMDNEGNIYSNVVTPFYKNSPLNFGEVFQ